MTHKRIVDILPPKSLEEREAKEITEEVEIKIRPQRIKIKAPIPPLKKVEDMVNQKIKEDLPVICQETTLKEAKEKGATGVFETKYGEKVKVYGIGEFSKEICGGPHAERTSELGRFKILKEESSAAGVRRIRAILK